MEPPKVVVVREHTPTFGQWDHYSQKKEDAQKDREYAKKNRLDERLMFRCYPEGDFEIYPSSFVGLVRLPSGLTIQVSQKVDSDLAEMLEHLQERDEIEKKVFFDPEQQVDIPKGFHFFPLVAFLFAREVKKIMKMGLAKRYVSEAGNLRRMRGQIDFVKNERLNYSDRSRLYCKYDDLSYDILENRVVLYCINRLLYHLPKWVVRNQSRFSGLQTQLNRYAMDLSEQVSEQTVTLDELRRLPRTRLNRHYSDALKLAEMIISEQVYSGFRANSQQRPVGVNFLVDMNWVFECFISSMVHELNEEEWKQDGWEVLLQNKSQDLLVRTNSRDTNPPRIMPDLLIENKKKKLCIPVDIKYKLKPGSGDYYQIISYSLAKKSDICALIVADSDERTWDEQQNPRFSLNPEIRQEGLDISIIGVSPRNPKQVKEELKMKIGRLIQSSV